MIRENRNHTDDEFQSRDVLSRADHADQGSHFGGCRQLTPVSSVRWGWGTSALCFDNIAIKRLMELCSFTFSLINPKNTKVITHRTHPIERSTMAFPQQPRRFLAALLLLGAILAADSFRVTPNVGSTRQVCGAQRIGTQLTAWTLPNPNTSPFSTTWYNEYNPTARRTIYEE